MLSLRQIKKELSVSLVQWAWEQGRWLFNNEKNKTDDSRNALRLVREQHRKKPEKNPGNKIGKREFAYEKRLG